MPFSGEFHKQNVEPLIKKLKTAIEFAKCVEEIKWADETRPLWAEVYPELSEGKPGLIGAITARAEAYVTRLACIYALLDSSTQIKPQHLKAALAIWDYADGSVKYIFQDATGDPLANEILETLINNPQGMTRTDISNYLNRNYSSEQISNALQILESLEFAYKLEISTDGRPKELWFASQIEYEINELNEKRATG